MTTKELLGEDFYKLLYKEFEDCRVRRKSRKGKLDQYDYLLLELDKMFESFCRRFL